jgi:hypothetical protein
MHRRIFLCTYQLDALSVSRKFSEKPNDKRAIFETEKDGATTDSSEVEKRKV